ncbi:CGNR zinc finger domain-containing protein [Streptomyces mirabilis]
MRARLLYLGRGRDPPRRWCPHRHCSNSARARRRPGR